jgi:anti-anti-sigma regulatory factor
VLNHSSAPEVRFAISSSRRAGIDRLFLVGDLDRSSVLMLEGELNAVARAGRALILDLRELTSIDRWGLHTLERVARGSGLGPRRLSLVHCHGPVLDAFEAAGLDDLLSGTDRSDPLRAAEERP